VEVAIFILVVLIFLVTYYTERLTIGLYRHVDRVDRKLSLILKELNINFDETPVISDRVKEIARDPQRKIEAIKAYRDETGQGLYEAKQAVEEYISSLPR
jgi:uncharacterized protein YoxC